MKNNFYPRNWISFLLSCFILFPIQANSGHHPQAFLQSIQGSQEEGQQIVKHFCASCHANKPLIQLGAPRVGQESDWLPRVSEGFLPLIVHTEEGFRAMPARGGCFECSDQQLLLALLAMLPAPLAKRALIELRGHKKSTK